MTIRNIAGRRLAGAIAIAVSFVLAIASPIHAQTDPLPSWNDGAAKKAIIDLVTRTTTQGSADFVPEPERIATFDNDGTLWCEMPFYFQMAFAFDRIKAMAPQHPEWKTKQPFKALLQGDVATAAKAGEKGLLAIVAATHSGMTVPQFEGEVREWIRTARHPRFKRPYNELIYQPMLEVLNYLRANGFKTFIVSGGGMDFMRPWAPAAYGIPPQQIVGSSGVTQFRLNKEGKGELFKTAKVDFIDDGPGKPVGINRNIGRQPIIAFGNSDGDLQMLQYTSSGSGARLGLFVHHDDAVREYAYDRKSQIGKLDKGLNEAPKWGWPIISMKNDWKVIFPFEKQ
ncbi:HAD family hydrolase [Pseudorhodoplanes sp.]|uniref:HAD family hydrolase n=1 Tax=Pseudorhodoplanes sp. TaxID=1934341 RepID=UPI003D0AFA98